MKLTKSQLKKIIKEEIIDHKTHLQEGQPHPEHENEFGTARYASRTPTEAIKWFFYVADKIFDSEEKKNKVFDPEDEALKAVRKIANYFAVDEDWLAADKDVQEWRWSLQELTMHELENVRDGIEYESKGSNRGYWIRDWTFAKGPDGKPIGGEPEYANEAFDAVYELARLYLDSKEIRDWTGWKFLKENKYKEKKMKITKSQLRQIIKEEVENLSEMGYKASQEEDATFYGQPPESELDKMSAEENADFYEAVAKLMRQGKSEAEALNIARSM